MDRFAKILVPVDGSKASYECVRLACHLAAMNDAEIHLVHVIDTGVIELVEHASKASAGKMSEEAVRQAEGYFKSFIKSIGEESDKQFQFVTEILRGKNVDEEIINYTQQNAIELIVIPLVSKTHSGIGSIGHITLRIVEFSGIPVLTVPYVTTTS
jgi:nucleotide-binding universal stress UspA family protein